MKYLISVLFVMAILAKGGYAQAETEGVGTLFSFSSATVDSIDAMFNNMTKVMLSDTLSDESFELTKTVNKITKKTVRITYTLTYQHGNQLFKTTFDTAGQILTVLTNNVMDQREMFKYSSKKEYYKQWFTIDGKSVRSKKFNFAVYSIANSEKDWRPRKKELIANISAINHKIYELEEKFSS